MRRFLFSFFLLLAASSALHAQLQIGMTLKRKMFMAHEPILVNISISNLSGRDVPLTDADGQHWFGFSVMRDESSPIAPLDPKYELTPLIVPAGATVTRTVNLNALFPVHDYGSYKVRAAIYFAALQKFFESPLQTIEISEGKTVWQKVVGIPDGQPNAGSLRRMSLLRFRQLEHNHLYVRVEDSDGEHVYCTTSLGRLIDTGSEPQVQLDTLNRLHILHSFGPKSYLYSIVAPDGGVFGRRVYLADKSRPVLNRDRVGEVVVVGGEEQDPTTKHAAAGTASAGSTVPKLSDRPIPLPQD